MSELWQNSDKILVYFRVEVKFAPMHYLFRDVAYRHKIIRFVRLPQIVSEGNTLTTNIAEMRILSQYLECREPYLIVVALLGRGIIGCSNQDKTRNLILQAFQKEHPRLPDKNYEWKAAEIVID